jgi:hypothetical protein
VACASSRANSLIAGREALVNFVRLGRGSAEGDASRQKAEAVESVFDVGVGCLWYQLSGHRTLLPG